MSNIAKYLMRWPCNLALDLLLGANAYFAALLISAAAGIVRSRQVR